ncbi:MAG: FtsX-like permease family protein [Campylobacterales bacterium]|nr:FtsX-like permease family protein [Campylobacterales bacterium]
MVANALKALRANRLKTTLIYASLTFSLIAIFLITAISHGVISMYASILKSDGDIIVTQAKISDTFFSNVDMQIIPQIERLSGVNKVSALIVGASPVEHLPIVAIYGSSTNRFSHYALLLGDYPKAGEVIIGKAIKTQLNHPKEVKIADKIFTVSGMFESDLGFENGGILMGIEDAGEIFNKSASMLLINVDLGTDTNRVLSSIQKLSQKIEAKSTQHFVDNYNQFKIINTSSNVVSFIALIMGLLGIASVMSITVNERREEFGIMKALGICAKKISFGLFTESVIIGVLSFVSAFLLATLLLYAIKHTAMFQGYINGEISAWLSFEIFVATLIITVLGALLPAYSASKIDPIILIQGGKQ